jgi:hypothetical protein
MVLHPGGCVDDIRGATAIAPEVPVEVVQAHVVGNGNLGDGVVPFDEIIRMDGVILASENPHIPPVVAKTVVIDIDVVRIGQIHAGYVVGKSVPFDHHIRGIGQADIFLPVVQDVVVPDFAGGGAEQVDGLVRVVADVVIVDFEIVDGPSRVHPPAHVLQHHVGDGHVLGEDSRGGVSRKNNDPLDLP